MVWSLAAVVRLRRSTSVLAHDAGGCPRILASTCCTSGSRSTPASSIITAAPRLTSACAQATPAGPEPTTQITRRPRSFAAETEHAQEETRENDLDAERDHGDGGDHDAQAFGNRQFTEVESTPVVRGQDEQADPGHDE